MNNGLLVLYLLHHFWKRTVMLFLEQQYLELENVLSYRTRVDINRLNGILSYVEKNADALGLTVTGNILFTVTEKISEHNKCIVGIEILIPVNKKFESCEQYIYKPVFKLVNAVSVRHCGMYSDIEMISSLLEGFLKESNLKPISNIYYMAVRNDEDHPLSSILDAYVSVNGNLL